MMACLVEAADILSQEEKVNPEERLENQKSMNSQNSISK